MRVLFALVFLLPLVMGWKQCGSPSEQVVKVSDIQVETALREDSHWAKVTLKGSTSRTIPATSVLQIAVRLGGIRIPLDDKVLGQTLGPGPIEYVYETLFDAPEGIVTHVKLVVVDEGKTVLCLRDLEVDL